MDDHTKEFETVTLVNLTKVDATEWTVYIGRSNAHYGLSESMFSNPYRVNEYGRETAVRLYELWLYREYVSDAEFRKQVSELMGETVACWCLPKACHGSVLCKLVDVIQSDDMKVAEYIVQRVEKVSKVLFGFGSQVAETRKEIKQSSFEIEI